MLRQPIITIMGHVDHGKTSILDAIRGSAIAAKEAGGITQAIGASIIPEEALQKVCGTLLKKLNINLTIPGLLFIDTPGHAAFIHHRKRGGDLADIAILVVSITEGLMPQTIECIDILKSTKTPFIVIANKIDLISGWQTKKEMILHAIEKQAPAVKTAIETKMYELVGALYEHGLNAERFDRVQDYTKQVAIIPASARTKEGIPEALMVLCGLTQKYLEKNLEYNPDGPAQGVILEVKEAQGLGSVIDVILFDGTLNTGDTITFGGETEPITTKVRTLLMPEPLAEMREKKSPFKIVKHARAATGVRISGTDLDKAIAGTPLLAGDSTTARETIKKDIAAVTKQHDKEGVVAKADTLGSLEALITLLKEKKIPIIKSGVGNITKKDIIDAQAEGEKNPLHGVVLGFNVQAAPSEGTKIITHNVIYQIIEDYTTWVAEQKKAIELGELDHLIKPCKIQLLPGYIFRQSNPAIVGVEVQGGALKTGTPLMNTQGDILTVAKEIKKEQDNLSELKYNDRAAVALPNLVIGRNIKAGDILYSSISEEHFRRYKEYKKYLREDEKTVLKEIAELMREKNPVWGV